MPSSPVSIGEVSTMSGYEKILSDPDLEEILSDFVGKIDTFEEVMDFGNLMIGEGYQDCCIDCSSTLKAVLQD